MKILHRTLFQPRHLALPRVQETQLSGKLRNPERPLQRLHQLAVPREGAGGRQGAAKEHPGAEPGPAGSGLQQHDQGMNSPVKSVHFGFVLDFTEFWRIWT